MSEAKQERDPRLDPIAGDVLLIGKHDIEASVQEITNGVIRYTVPTNRRPLVCDCPTLLEWRKWAATATVIKRGDE